MLMVFTQNTETLMCKSVAFLSVFHEPVNHIHGKLLLKLCSHGLGWGLTGDISVEKECSYDSPHPETDKSEASISQKNYCNLLHK